jgi:hypothetical protein
MYVHSEKSRSKWKRLLTWASRLSCTDTNVHLLQPRVPARLLYVTETPDPARPKDTGVRTREVHPTICIVDNGHCLPLLLKRTLFKGR